MADQHHESAPAMGNQISADIPDISEAISYHWDLLQMLLGVDSTTLANISPPGEQRSKFSYSDTDTITIGPGIYFHDGTTRQTVFWDADITFDLGSAGSNAGSDDIDAGAQAVHYIYLDDSAIVTQASPELDAGCFLNTDVTAPTWSDAKHGWYNGSDRCIFAVITSAANAVLEFHHDGGDYVHYAADILDVNNQDIDNAWEDISTALSVPTFCTKVKVFIQAGSGDSEGALLYRPNGSSGTGTRILSVDADVTGPSVMMDVITDSSQLFELYFGSGASTNIFDVYTVGWFFPTGM